MNKRSKFIMFMTILSTLIVVNACLSLNLPFFWNEGQYAENGKDITWKLLEASKEKEETYTHDVERFEYLENSNTRINGVGFYSLELEQNEQLEYFLRSCGGQDEVYDIYWLDNENPNDGKIILKTTAHHKKDMDKNKLIEEFEKLGMKQFPGTENYPDLFVIINIDEFLEMGMKNEIEEGRNRVYKILKGDNSKTLTYNTDNVNKQVEQDAQTLNK